MSYAIVDNEVRYRGMIADRAEPASFVALPWGWGKDRARVYSHGCVVEGAEPRSFVPLDDTFGRDADRVYGGHAALEADVATFRTLGGGYGADAHHVCYGELRLGWLVACWKLETADPSTFVVRAHGWAVDAAHAYCAGHVSPEADPNTLVPLTRRLATDATHVLAYTRVLDADPASFRALDEHYGIDERRVYHGDTLARVVAPANRATFRVLGHDFAVDDRYAYWSTDVIAGVVPATLRVLAKHFACADGQVLYFYRGIHRTRPIADDLYGVKPIVLPDAEPSTFRDSGELYGADTKRAYHHGVPIALRGDARRFETLAPRIARDDVAVYHESEVLDGADPATFRIVAPATIARDRARWYLYDAYGEYPSIEVIDEDRARAVLSGNELTEDAD